MDEKIKEIIRQKMLRDDDKLREIEDNRDDYKMEIGEIEEEIDYMEWVANYGKDILYSISARTSSSIDYMEWLAKYGKSIIGKYNPNIDSIIKIVINEINHEIECANDKMKELERKSDECDKYINRMRNRLAQLMSIISMEEKNGS